MKRPVETRQRKIRMLNFEVSADGTSVTGPDALEVSVADTGTGVKTVTLNEERFNLLKSKKDDIEKEFGHNLEWNFVPNRKTQKVRYNIEGYGLKDQEHWDEIQNNMITLMKKFVLTMQKYVNDLPK